MGVPISHVRVQGLVEDFAPAPRADATAGWRSADLSRADGVARLIADCRAIADRASGASLYNDLEWMLGKDQARTDRVRVLRYRGVGVEGYAALLVKQRPLRYQLGEMTLYARSLRFLSLSGEPLLAFEHASDIAREAAIAGLLRAIRGTMIPGDALALEGVAVGGALDRIVTGSPVTSELFEVARLGPAFERQLIDMPADWPSYEAQLGSRSRKSLRYSRNKLSEHVGGALETRCFTRPEEVEHYLADAVRISQKTYQWNLLGLGLRDQQALAERLSFSAERGWLRCYILYCRDVPTAFMLGMLHHGTYYYLDVGYDPDWAKWSVGSVLQVEVMRDLFGLPEPPRRFDFATGYGTHKARFANLSRREVNYLLLPRGLRSALLLGGYRATEAMSTELARLLERYQLKARLKKLLRGRAVARGQTEAPGA